MKNLFSFGGCVYRMQVDGRHAASLAHLASIASPARLPSKIEPQPKYLAEIDYMHTSNLPQGRALWLRRQMWQGTNHTMGSNTGPGQISTALRWAISADGDTTFDASQLYAELDLVDGQIAMGIAPVRIGGTEELCNINITEADEQVSRTSFDRPIPSTPGFGRRAFMAELAKVYETDRLIQSGGFGLVVFNLDWFRKCWPDPAPEHVSIDSGEDIEFCRSVKARGGLIALLKVKTDHFAFGEKQTR